MVNGSCESGAVGSVGGGVLAMVGGVGGMVGCKKGVVAACHTPRGVLLLHPLCSRQRCHQSTHCNIVCCSAIGEPEKRRF